MNDINTTKIYDALQDFRQARLRADIKDIVARLTGESDDLLSYDEVRQKLKAQGIVEQVVKEIPIDAIVGSVNRYEDFTRGFLPRIGIGANRWARVVAAADGMTGWPPIRVYQIGGAFFVEDGNHRVSASRQMGATDIQAYVTVIHSRVPISPEDKLEDIILKAEYADFLDHTHIIELRPEADLKLTAPGQYKVLEEHISVHRYFMGLDLKREIPYEEAVAHWYDIVYMPIVIMILERGLLREFPNRTEADLYLWIADRRAILEQEFEEGIQPDKAVDDLAERFSSKTDRLSTRISKIVRGAVIPTTLEAGPPPGEWRKHILAVRHLDRLFSDILVPVDGDIGGWYALEQAFVITRREEARIHGLHVLPPGADKDNPGAVAVKEEFHRRCEEAKIPGKLVISSGDISQKICERSQWNDLIVVNMAFPPAQNPLTRLSSGFRDLVQRCPRPLLAVPQAISPLNQALLAYDGSPKANEALFVATYFASKWNMPLVVVSILQENRVTPDNQSHAKEYLESHGVQAKYVSETGDISSTILKVAVMNNSDLIVMGGYGHTPLFNILINDVVDQVLRDSPKPMLLCR